MKKQFMLAAVGALCAVHLVFAADQALGPWTWHDAEHGLLWTFNGQAFGNNDQDWQVTITGVRPYDADKAVSEVEIPAYVGENGQFRVMQFGVDADTAVFAAGCTNVTKVTFAEDATEVIPTFSCMKGTKWWKDHCSSVPIVLNDIYLLQFTTNTVTADQKVSVPSSVKVIGVHAGANCGKVTTLEFAYGTQVERIGRRAFDGLGAAELTIPDTVTRIDTIAFGANVKCIKFGKGLEKLDHAWFWDYSRVTGWGALAATALADITMGDGMADLPLDIRYRTNGTEDRIGIFEGLTTLTNIVISKEVASIGDRTFSGCTKLAQVKFGGQEERIGERAFFNTTALKTIEIPNSVTEIGVNAFNGSGLEKLTFAKDTALATIGRNAFNGCTKLGIVALPDTLEAVSDGAFSGCTSLSNLVLGTGIAYIGRDAFLTCGSLPAGALTYVSIPDSVAEIYEDAFNGCKFLTNIIASSSTSLETIADNAFAGTPFCGRKEGSYSPAVLGSILVGFNGICEGKIEVPDGIVQIHENAFYRDVTAGETNRMTTVVLPSTVEVIGANAFLDCKSLTAVEWGGSERFIETSAFQGCVALTGLELPGSLERIGTRAFQGCGSITKVEIPDGLETVAGNCFLNCSNLTEVAIGAGVRSIGNNAFDGCERMKTLEFLNNDTFRTIGTSAFRLCKELTEISLPDSTFAIQANAFDMCSNLTEVAVGDTLEYVGPGAFRDTRLMKSSKLVMVGNVLVGYDPVQIRDRDEIEIEDGVVSIAEDAFKDCGLGAVVIPESVKWIFNNAFANCSNLWKTVVQNPDVCLQNDPAIKKNGTLFSTTVAVTKPGYTFQGGIVGGAPRFDGDGIGGLNLAMSRLNLAKITFRTDPEGDGDFVAGESYTGWLKDPATFPANAMVGTITVKTSKPDKLGRVKIVATVTMNGVKKVFTESVVPENGKAEGIYSLHGLKLGGKWLDGTLTYAGHQYVLEGGVSVAKTEPARFDAFNKHVWALRFTSAAPVNGYPWTGWTWDDAPLARGDCTLTVQPSGKGKVKVSGILGDGTKVSATAQMVAGDGGANCAAVSIPLYAGKRGGFSFLLWFYVNEDNKPVAYVDETYDCAANWVFPVDFGKEAFVYVPINIASGAEVDVNDKIALRWPDRMAFRVGGFAGVVYDEIKNLEIDIAELEKRADLVNWYSDVAVNGGGYGSCYRNQIRVTVNEKGKWECAKAPKFKFSVTPDESSSVVSALDAAGRIFGQVSEGKYVKIIKGTDGLGNGWNPVTDVGTRPDYNGHGVRLGYLLIDEGVKPDKSGNLATNLSGLKLSYKPKTGEFNGSYVIQSIDVANPESPKLKKTKVAVNGVVIDGLGYGTAVIKGLGSQTCSIVVDR